MSANPFKNNSPEHVDWLHEFRLVSTELARLGELAGVEITPFYEPSLPVFSQLPVEAQMSIVGELNGMAQLVSSVEPTKSDYSYNRRSAWALLKARGLVFTSDVFEKLQDEDIIEIWDTQGRVIFRSFHSLRYTSYTIEELFSYPFYELFERDTEIETQYADWFKRILGGEVTGTIELDIPRHLVREKLSRRQRTSYLTPKYVSPLRDKSGRITAFFHTCRAENVDAGQA